MRSKAWERIYFGVAALAGLGATSEFARHGGTDLALFALIGAASWAGLGGFMRHQRRLTEFKERYPGWRGEYHFGKRHH